MAVTKLPASSPEAQIILKHDALIGALARRFLSVDADDLCQVGRIALIEAARTWSPDRGAQLWTYARRAVLGAMLDAVTKEVDGRDVEISGIDADVCDDATSADDACIAAECSGLLSKLSQTQREIVIMRIVDEYDFKTIAARTSRSIGDCYRAYQSALAKLRRRATSVAA